MEGLAEQEEQVLHRPLGEPSIQLRSAEAPDVVGVQTLDLVPPQGGNQVRGGQLRAALVGGGLTESYTGSLSQRSKYSPTVTLPA